MAWDWTPASLSALAQFLEDHDLTRGAVETTRIGDGHSNLTYLVSDGRTRVIVRRPPPPPTPRGANDMLREARFMAALANTPVPVPDILATAHAGDVLDVPLYVMSVQDGPVVTTRTPAPLDSEPVRREIGENLIDTLAALHSVDWRLAGLSDAGKPEGFNSRHLRSLSRLNADADAASPREFVEIERWLGQNVPPESGASIVHNDYRIGNVVLAPDAPGRVRAVLDWELATIGDPLFDLGYFLGSIPEPGAPRTPTEDLGTAMLEQGYPTRAELAARYSLRTGRDLTNLGWYSALALWKLAVLYEYGRRRFVTGAGDDYYADATQVRRFLDAAHRVAGLSPLGSELE